MTPNGEMLNLPHDDSIEQAFTTQGEAESGYLPGGNWIGTVRISLFRRTRKTKWSGLTLMESI